MSFDVIRTCRKAVLGNASHKHVLAYMAERASKDGTGIWCSKGRIARETELNISTVKKAVGRLLQEGILVKTGRRHHDYGYTAVYKIALDAVEKLHPKDPTTEVDEISDTSTTPVSAEPGVRVYESGPHGSPVATNTPETPFKPPSDTDSSFKKAWLAFPVDKRREEDFCRCEFKRAVRGGTPSEDIVQAVIQYAHATKTHSRDKVCFVDNWFRQRRWNPILRQLRSDREAKMAAIETSLERCRKWIGAKDPMCAHISQFQVKTLLDRKLVTVAELEAAGISVHEAIVRRA